MNRATKDIDYHVMATTISLHSASNYNVIEHHPVNRGQRTLIQTKKSIGSGRSNALSGFSRVFAEL